MKMFGLDRRQWQIVLIGTVAVAVLCIVPLVVFQKYMQPRMMASRQMGGANPFQTATGHWRATAGEPVMAVLCRWQEQFGSKAGQMLLSDIIVEQSASAEIEMDGDIGQALFELQHRLPADVATTTPVIWHDGTIGFMGSRLGGAPQEVLFRVCHR